MGIYDREYYRDEQPEPGHQWSQRLMVTNLVIVNVALFLLNMFLVFDKSKPNWLTEALSVSPDVLGRPWLWWKLATYGFVHAPGQIGHIFWNLLGLWMFGREVEQVYGRKEFLRFYLAALVLGSLVWCTIEHLTRGGNPSLLGASGAVTAVTLLFVLHFPKRTVLLMMVLPVPAWVLGVLIIVGNVWQVDAMTNSQRVAYDVHLVGAVFAICYYRFGWNLGRWLPDLRRWRRTAARARPRLRVHDPDDEREPLDEEADRILEKVGREGLERLSPRERRVLEDYSRRMRRKLQ